MRALGSKKERPTAGGAYPSRVFLLDELRGFLILYVIVYHFLYDLCLFGLVSPTFMFSTSMEHLRNFFVGILMGISGICCHLSRSNWRRGLKTLGAALLVSAVTLLVMREQAILFGILHFFGCAMLLYAPLKRPLSRVPAWVGISLSFLLFFLTFSVKERLFGIAAFGWAVPLPSFLYQTPFLFPLGLPSSAFRSSDYCPLLPWFFLFLAGSFCGRAVKEGLFPRGFYRSHCKPLAAIGRHTLLVYLVHQPLIYGLCWLIARLFG